MENYINSVNIRKQNKISLKKPKFCANIRLYIGLGYGFGAVPEGLKYLPETFKLIFGGTGLVLSGTIAILLNIILPEDKHEVIA